jgi:hypothetical protein
MYKIKIVGLWEVSVLEMMGNCIKCLFNKFHNDLSESHFIQDAAGVQE